MKKLALLLVLAALPSTARADGCPPSVCGTATVAVAGSPTLAVRPGGARGPALVYDLGAGKKLFELRGGLLSANGRRHFVTRSRKRVTAVERFDARTGRLRATWTMPGRWFLNAASADGRRLVFAALVKGRHAARSFVVADGTSGRPLHRFTLRGNREAEAVSRDGRHLFLVQWLRRGYVVRSYDVAARTLSTLRARGEPRLMGGIPWGAVASADGRWLLTLLLEPGGGVAIHTLDLLRRTAACIDLPAKSAETARNYTLVLGAGGRRAFAANASAGIVAAVDLVAHRITATARFRPLTDMRPFGGTGTVLRGRAYFGAESSVWSYDIRRNGVMGPYDVGRRVLGIGAAPNARTVRVVRFDGRVVRLRRND